MIRLTRYGIKYFIILVLILVVFILGYQAGKSLFLSQIAEWWFSVTYKVEKAPSENVMGLDLRAYHLAADPREYDTELSSYFFYEHQEIPVDKAALVLVDVWEQKSNNDGWNERKEEIISTNIYNVLQAARATNMLVIHAPSLQVINHTVSPLENEIVLDSSNWITDDRELNIILQKHHVETVFYVGFATDICILDRPYGIKKMHDLGYQIILLRDCTSGFEYDDTLGKMWVTEIAVREVEAMPHGYSCTANDFMKGLKPQ